MSLVTVAPPSDDGDDGEDQAPTSGRDAPRGGDGGGGAGVDTPTGGDTGGGAGAGGGGGTSGTAGASAGTGGEDGGAGTSGSAGSSGGTGGSPAAGAPIFLSFDTNVSTLLPGDSLIFSAILTDPDGIDDLIGGSLVDPVGGDTYGTFATAATEGAYSLTLTWNAIDAVRTLESGVGGSPRPFRAEFFDQDGHKSTEEISVTVTCDNMGSFFCDAAMQAGYECLPIVCDGTCLDARDPNNCGGCRTKCPMDQACSIVEGRCVPN